MLVFTDKYIPDIWLDVVQHSDVCRLGGGSYKGHKSALLGGLQLVSGRVESACFRAGPIVKFALTLGDMQRWVLSKAHWWPLQDPSAEPHLTDSQKGPTRSRVSSDSQGMQCSAATSFVRPGWKNKSGLHDLLTSTVAAIIAGNANGAPPASEGQLEGSAAANALPVSEGQMGSTDPMALMQALQALPKVSGVIAQF